ncbi:hypothetical protein OB955_09310 [Halobacteria archaeon AArc-m2/3/4]|uniref:Small CPxCG-related zinc finger protein n=1 Tax=Natronoglomus mannanivorans TaxID=2979990 RepID=A0ABT2QDD7_9EURY|nr:hypothetical protein [Halobacteria archaeon AArc-m2/3/4]
MADLRDFGLKPQDPPEGDDDDRDDDPEPRWPECDDCGYVGREVTGRLNQSVPLCTACFVEREGLL